MEPKIAHTIKMYLFIVTSDQKNHIYFNIENLTLLTGWKLGPDALLYAVAPALEAGSMGAIVSIALLHVLVGLLLLPLLLLLIGLPVLPGAAHAPEGAAGKTADGRPFSGAAAAPGNAADNRTAGTSQQATTERAAAYASPFLRRRRRAGGGHLHGIKARLPLGPVVTLEFVLLHLIVALTLGRVNHNFLSPAM